MKKPCMKCDHYKPCNVRCAINLDRCTLKNKLCTEINYGRDCEDCTQEVSDDEL